MCYVAHRTRVTTVISRSQSTDTGAVIIGLLYGLSVFSVLALTVLTNGPLENAFRESTDPDLHVVLYVAGERTPEITGRMNLPTSWRQAEPEIRKSIELRTQAPLDMDPASALPAGWSYTVNLPHGARLCCDGGDKACEDPTALLRVYEGSVTPAMDRPLATSGDTRHLEFELSAFDLADNLNLDPSLAFQPGFAIKATRIPEGAEGRSVDPAHSPVSCSLRSGDTTVATGVLRVVTTPTGTDGTRVSSGTVELEYKANRDRTK